MHFFVSLFDSLLSFIHYNENKTRKKNTSRRLVMVPIFPWLFILLKIYRYFPNETTNITGVEN